MARDCEARSSSPQPQPAPAAAPGTATRRPTPLLHTPVVAISLALLLASIAQFGVRLATAHLGPQSRSTPSVIATQSPFFGYLEGAVSRCAGSPLPNRKAAFAIHLLIALASVPAWYGAARVALGPPWALWTAMLWATHPLFALLSQHPTPLHSLMLVLPFWWCLLLAWRRRPRPAAAVFLGFGLAALCLVAPDAAFLVPVAVLGMIAAPRSLGQRAIAAVTTAAACACGVAVIARAAPGGFSPADWLREANADAWQAIETPSSSPLAQTAFAWRAAHPGKASPSWVRFVAEQMTRSPRSLIAWLVRRAAQSVYATADGRLQRPLLALQLAWFVPALWGFCVSLGHPPWRFMAVTGALVVAVRWGLAAAAEPLARNLTPVGGIILMFALVGLADTYERVFGRRLTR